MGAGAKHVRISPHKVRKVLDQIRDFFMGQKTHPLGFRLGITQNHRSAWYADFRQYSSLLEEDDKIRTYISNVAKFASISNIYISRNGVGDRIELNIETARPGMLIGDKGSKIKTLASNIKKFYIS